MIKMVKKYQTHIPNFLSIDLLRAATITSKMTAPNIYLFISNLENVVIHIRFAKKMTDSSQLILLLISI